MTGGGFRKCAQSLSDIQQIFLHWSYGTSILKNEKAKKWGSSCLKLAQIVLEPTFHDAGTFSGFRKCAQSLSDIQRIFNTGPYGDPP